jgi:PBSX family phage terminase large subunit
MDTSIQISPKQAEYIQNANSRWNIKIGATQCGKTFIDVQYVIPHRISERAGRKGLNVILGVSKETIERNVLEPMRDIWGEKLISPINSRNFATIMGEKVYCLGAEKVSQVSKLRGAKFKYVYVDEIVDINAEVFQLLKSRLSLPYSVCDASGNPSYPTHFIKKFIDSKDKGVDVYCQQWTLYDNPFLSPGYVHALESEYDGTVFFDRYILGKWTQAEGLIYPMYLNALEEASPDPAEVCADRYALSIDYGTQNAFAALLWAKKGMTWHAIREYYYSGRDEGSMKTDDDYLQEMEEFVADVVGVSQQSILTIIDPSAASFIAALRKSGKFSVRKADNDMMNGIRDTANCLKKGKVKISSGLSNWRKEIEGYVWDKKEGEDRPIKVNDHLMDSMRYFVRTMRLAKSGSSGYKSPFGG